MATRRRNEILAVLLIVGLTVLAASGCGSSSSTTSTAGSTSGGTSSSSEETTTSNSKGTTSSGDKGIKSFLVPGSENSVVKLGKEASSSDIEAVSAVLEESFDARASKDWEGQCATLSAQSLTTLEKTSGAVGKKGCAAVLAAEGDKAPASLLKNNIDEGVGALRVQGNKGFALYHGTDKKDWVMPVEKEGGEWKVAALIATELPGS